MLQLGQSYLYGTQSSLTTIILNDAHPHTIYVNNLQVRLQSDTKICGRNCDDDEINDACELSDDFVDDCTRIEGITKESTDAFTNTADSTDQTGTDNVRPQDPTVTPKPADQTKPKNNRWATKRALQNKKPKFKIFTECTKECFKRVQIDVEELQTIMKSERDSVYFMSKKFKCQKCVLTFTSREVLEKHEQKFHSKSTKYICDICTSSIASKRLLSQHIKGHYNKYACTLCDFSCYDKSQIRWHQQRRHRKIFQCLKCELKFWSRWEFYKHYKEWHEKFICDHCGISFKMRYCIKDHIRKQHSPFECKPCNKRWARYNGLWLHNKTAHDIGVAAYCVECDKQYRDVYRYRWHLANSTRHRHHDKHSTATCTATDGTSPTARATDTTTNIGQCSTRGAGHNKTAHDIGVAAYCVECDKQYRDVYRYRWHLANSTRHRHHDKHSTATCTATDGTSPTARATDTTTNIGQCSTRGAGHNKTAHDIGVAAYCVECDKQYRDVYRYRWHLANSTRHRHHDKHRIPCPGCDKVFSKNIYMKDHYNLVHLKFYKYRCEQCDKNFIRNADLVKHTRRVHEGILPPKNKICYICGRGFSTNKILTNHLRTHTGEKPFVCTICNARFAQSTALSAHARAIHHTVMKQA
ncbi:hypothetical protein PYW07_012639 [Mythimna separata]|uniref:C2H2-type domain-containing protein n=1 Tax=Mythimna separata TaxID=271217 RepID=A0AAD7Y8P5_MYTSE|nr:hypothetical protein PYW07_012639 [Mythimna separata]